MTEYLSPDIIRAMFSSAMSEMYRNEVPQYGTLLSLVSDVNRATLENNPALAGALGEADELARLDEERHGAIRLGTAEELFNIRRMFAVMGMHPVGYYDLSVAGIPVHSTAFRPIESVALKRNPFRVFTSLLRLDLIDDDNLAKTAKDILARRQIITPSAFDLIAKAEQDGGLAHEDAERFISEALETFRWHAKATVNHKTYQRLHGAHRLIADVVCFRGPHINHLTPRTLDIDAVQRQMPERGIAPKAFIEGPPHRQTPLLLRQTSFKALEEDVLFLDDGAQAEGTHTARFGEIEQRGVALTPKGRALYDAALSNTRNAVKIAADGKGATDYMAQLETEFAILPDDLSTLREKGLAYVQYRVGSLSPCRETAESVDALLAAGVLIADPQTYEDFLPVSAAGIFQSNLGSDAQSNYDSAANQDAFEAALGAPVADPMALYADIERQSLTRALNEIGRPDLS